MLVAPIRFGEGMIELSAALRTIGASSRLAAQSIKPLTATVSVGFVGIYPPTQCGIATFNASLRAAIGPSQSGVVALVDDQGATDFGPEVIAEIAPGSPEALERAAALLDRFDVVVIQREFGIYGGKDGSEVLNIVEHLWAPTIVVLHTVLQSPSPDQRTIIERLAETAEALVVQSAAARSALLHHYRVGSATVHVIPHGAPSNFDHSPQSRRRRPFVLMWGLLGRGKGIEYAIKALASLRGLDPPPRYVVHGHTHPRVTEREGEAYRESLIALAQALGVADLVEFDDRYTDTASLLALIREADVVLLPYLSHDQVVSGVLIEAIASGKPIVATPFPHAVELLREGSGILVPHRDGGAIAQALRRLLTDPEVAARASTVARRQAEPLLWENVGRTSHELAASVVAKRVKAAL
jgi:glycosyltransferase involved in cell wall biosynthesis